MNTQEAINITQDELESYEKMLESGHPEVGQIKKHIEICRWKLEQLLLEE